jgi:hypothetical protein
MRKIKFILLLIPLFLLLSGCGKETPMDQVSKKGKYEYKNEDLGFSLDLPEEFLYYQVQRKNGDGFIDLDIFLPTNDKARQLEVPGYWKPVMIKIYEKDAYESLSENSDEKKIFENAGEKNGRVYLLGFWQDTPDDWRENCQEGAEKRSSGYCWSDEVVKKVREGFNLL